MLTIEQKYTKTLDYIYSFINHSMTRQKMGHSDEYNLVRMKKFMELLGNPQNDYPTIHVAGTKGKGSVSAFISSALIKQGYKTGLYTSPHLIEFEERIQIDFKSIPKENLIAIVDEIKPVIDQLEKVTTFEIITAIGFLAFSKQKIDIAVIEVGLGGRLDATNFITPIVSVITTLAIDHTNYLGKSIEKIATEKAGIIKQDVPVILSQQEYKDTIDVIKKIAQSKNAEFINLHNKYKIQKIDRSHKSQTFEVEVNNKLKSFSINMLGDFQIINCLTAYEALLEISKTIELSKNSIMSGLSTAIWKGRFEILSENPIVVIDSAHNPYAMKKLSESLQNYFPDKEYILIFGVSIDKDFNQMISIIERNTNLIIASQSNHPKALAQEKIQQIAEKYDINRLFSENASNALTIALENIHENEIIVCTGSIFMAASLRAVFEEKYDNFN